MVRYSSDNEAQIPRRTALAPAPSGEASLLEMLDENVEGSLYDELAPLFQRARELVKNSVAPTTRASYESGWRQFERWCDAFELRPLPARIDTVVLYLTSLTVNDPLRASTIQVHLAAINKAHQLSRFAEPGKDSAVKTLMAGIRRTLGMRVHKKSPIRIADLRHILSATLLTPLIDHRDAAAIALRYAGLSGGQLARMGWEQLDLSLTRVTWHPARGGSVVVESSEDPSLCPVRALAIWRRSAGSPEIGPVFAAIGIDGVPRWDKPAAYQTLDAMVARRIFDAGIDSDDPADLSPTDAAAVLIDVLAPSAAVVRDYGLLVVGFASALRRSNLSALLWLDVTYTDDGIELFIETSKTDQERIGDWVALPYGQHPETCPVGALKRWQQRLRAELGHEPEPETPVFRAIDRHGNVGLQRLSPHGVAGVVRARALASGLEGDFAGHSLRSGLITSAAEAGASLEDIARQSRHKRLEVLRGYIQRANAFQDNVDSTIGM